MADDIVSRLEMIRGTQFTPTEDALVVEAAETITRLRSALKEREEAFGPLLEAAEGLSHGVDWNNGTHAKTHGYRRKLIEAIPKARASLNRKKDA